MSILFEDTFDSFNTWNYTQWWEGIFTTTWWVLKASSYWTWASWHWPTLTRSQSITWDFKVTGVINWNNSWTNAIGNIKLQCNLSNWDIPYIYIGDSQAASNSYELITSKDWAADIYYSWYLTNTNIAITWDIWVIEKIWTTITFYINWSQLWVTTTSIWNLTSVVLATRSFSTYNSIQTQEFQNIKIEDYSNVNNSWFLQFF